MLGIAFAIAYLAISVIQDVYESDLTTLSKIVIYVFAGGHLALFAINFFLVAITTILLKSLYLLITDTSFSAKLCC